LLLQVRIGLCRRAGSVAGNDPAPLPGSANAASPAPSLDAAGRPFVLSVHNNPASDVAVRAAELLQRLSHAPMPLNIGEGRLVVFVYAARASHGQCPHAQGTAVLLQNRRVVKLSV